MTTIPSPSPCPATAGCDETPVSIRRAVSRALLLLIAAAGLPGSARAGVLSWGPALDVEVREDQLPGVFEREYGWVARISPRLTLARAGETSTLELTGLRSFDTHRQFEGPERAGDAVALRFRTQPNSSSEVSTQASFVSSRDPLGIRERAPATFSESSIASGASRIDLWRLEGEYAVRARAYQSSQSSDGVAQTWEAAAFPLRRRDTRAVVAWTGRDLRIDDRAELTTHALTLGYRRIHFEGFQSELGIGGAMTRESERGTNRSDLAAIAAASVKRGTFHLPVDLTFRVARDVETTGLVEASLQGVHTQLAVRWEQELGAEGGLFRDPTLARYTSFEVRDTLAGHYAIRLEGSLGRTRSRFQPGLWLESQRAWASVSRRVLPWLAAGVDYSFVNQEADSSMPSWVFRRSRVGLRLTMGAL